MEWGRRTGASAVRTWLSWRCVWRRRLESLSARLCLSVGIAAGPVVLDSHPSAFFHIDPPISPFLLSPSLPSPLGLWTSSPSLLLLHLPHPPRASCAILSPLSLSIPLLFTLPPAIPQALPPFMPVCSLMLRRRMTGPRGYSTLTTTKWAGVEYDRAEPAVSALIGRHSQHSSAPLLLRRPLAGVAGGRLDNEGDAAVWHGAGERGSEAS